MTFQQSTEFDRKTSTYFSFSSFLLIQFSLDVVIIYVGQVKQNERRRS